MWTAGVAEIKKKLSQVLAQVKAGEEVVVTERGRPIAMIVPLPPMDSEREELVRAGIVRPAMLPLDDEFLEKFFSEPRPADPEGLALAALLEERRTGR